MFKIYSAIYMNPEWIHAISTSCWCSLMIAFRSSISLSHIVWILMSFQTWVTYMLGTCIQIHRLQFAHKQFCMKISCEWLQPSFTWFLKKSFSSLVSQCCIYVRCVCQCQFMWGNFRNLSTHFRSKLTGSSKTYLVSLLTICQRYQYDLWDMDLDTPMYMTIILFSERIPVVRRTISKMLTLADANHRTIL